MIRGGFDRKLDAEQVILYRDDWHALVATQRSRDDVVREAERARDQNDLVAAMTVAEIYREAAAFDKLAIHYHVFGNHDLRDKYIELALQEDPTDEIVTFLRALQGRQDLIPPEVVERELALYEEHQLWNQRARLLARLGRVSEATSDYLRTVQSSLNEKRYFSAAYYLRELSETQLTTELFVEAYRQARESGDLWWQIRALEELQWADELRTVLLEQAEVIDAMPIEQDPFVATALKRHLALARGDMEMAEKFRQEHARVLAGSWRRGKKQPRTGARKRRKG